MIITMTCREQKKRRVEKTKNPRAAGALCRPALLQRVSLRADEEEPDRRMARLVTTRATIARRR
jgi:hypothetical protein